VAAAGADLIEATSAASQWGMSFLNASTSVRAAGVRKPVVSNSN
jgi:hypothetical protein